MEGFTSPAKGEHRRTGAKVGNGRKLRHLPARLSKCVVGAAPKIALFIASPLPSPEGLSMHTFNFGVMIALILAGQASSLPSPKPACRTGREKVSGQFSLSRQKKLLIPVQWQDGSDTPLLRRGGGGEAETKAGQNLCPLDILKRCVHRQAFEEGS